MDNKTKKPVIFFCSLFVILLSALLLKDHPLWNAQLFTANVTAVGVVQNASEEDVLLLELEMDGRPAQFFLRDDIPIYHNFSRTDRDALQPGTRIQFLADSSVQYEPYDTFHTVYLVLITA